MPSLVIYGVVAALIAFVLYTISIFGARKNKRPKLFHVILAWVGLVFDVTATYLMSVVAGGWKWSTHGIIGFVAILLMLVNAIWATAVYSNKEAPAKSYLLASLIIWVVWLGSLVSGVIMDMH